MSNRPEYTGYVYNSSPYFNYKNNSASGPSGNDNKGGKQHNPNNLPSKSTWKPYGQPSYQHPEPYSEFKHSSAPQPPPLPASSHYHQKIDHSYGRASVGTNAEDIPDHFQANKNLAPYTYNEPFAYPYPPSHFYPFYPNLLPQKYYYSAGIPYQQVPPQQSHPPNIQHSTQGSVSIPLENQQSFLKELSLRNKKKSSNSKQFSKNQQQVSNDKDPAYSNDTLDGKEDKDEPQIIYPETVFNLNTPSFTNASPQSFLASNHVSMHSGKKRSLSSSGMKILEEQPFNSDMFIPTPSIFKNPQQNAVSISQTPSLDDKKLIKGSTTEASKDLISLDSKNYDLNNYDCSVIEPMKVESPSSTGAFFNGSIRPQELIIGEQLLTDENIEEINNTAYQPSAKQESRNNDAFPGETNTADTTINFSNEMAQQNVQNSIPGKFDLDFDFDIDVEYDNSFIIPERVQLNSFHMAGIPETTSMSHINNILIQEKQNETKKFVKGKSLLKYKKRNSKKNFSRENRPTPILLDNSDLAHIDLEEIAGITSPESKKNSLSAVAPQYVEDREMDSYSFLTKSTIQAVEQIRDDVMNNRNSKLTSFSPLVEEQSQHAMSSINTSTYNSMSHPTIFSPMSTLLGEEHRSNFSARSASGIKLNTMKYETPLSSVFDKATMSKKLDSSSSSIGGNAQTKKTKSNTKPSSTVKPSSITSAINATFKAVTKNGNVKTPRVSKNRVQKLNSAASAVSSLASPSLLTSSTKNEEEQTTVKKEEEEEPKKSLVQDNSGPGSELPESQNAEILNFFINLYAKKKLTAKRSKTDKNINKKKKGKSLSAEPICDNGHSASKGKNIKQEENQKSGTNEDEDEDEDDEDDDDIDDEDINTDTNNASQNQSASTEKKSLVEQMLEDKVLMDEILTKPKRGFFKCLHCDQTFSTVLDYAKHLDKEQIVRPFKCPFPTCPWKYLGLTKRNELRRHCAIQHMDDLTPEMRALLNLNDENFPIMVCNQEHCNKKFYRKDSYQRHMQMVHENQNSRFNKRLKKLIAQCPFTDPQEVQQYITTHFKA